MMAAKVKASKTKKSKPKKAPRVAKPTVRVVRPQGMQARGR